MSHVRVLGPFALTLDVAAKLHDALHVKVQYANDRQPGHLITAGALHLPRLLARRFVTALRHGGVNVRLTGSYMEGHAHEFVDAAPPDMRTRDERTVDHVLRAIRGAEPMPERERR